jgi:hypothetical protein
VLQARDVEQLHEPLVTDPRFRSGKAMVLIEDGRQAPFLELPQAPDDAAGSVLQRLQTFSSCFWEIKRLFPDDKQALKRDPSLPCLSCSE